MSQPTTVTGQTFAALGVKPKLLNILNKLNFTTPTPIQAQAIPVANRGRDVIGIAQTGTGKTLAFALPMIEQIAQTKKQGLIIVPTRELAEQVAETLHKVGQPLGLRHALIIGGAAMGRQISTIKRHPHVIVATPGRLNDHLEHGTIKLNAVGVLVLDEADRMLDMGFAPQINRILKHVPRQRQTLLFSATMPPAIRDITNQYMNKPVHVQVSPAGTVATAVNQELFVIPHKEKSRLLNKLLNDYTGTVLVFSRTKYGAKKICRTLRAMNHAAAEIHSNLTPGQRRRSLTGFKSGQYRIMVATDIASRGIDISDIELVINYDLPDQLEDYVHRVGRTGRAGKQGKAVSFVNPDQQYQIRTIERLVRQKLAVSPLPELPPGAPTDDREHDRRHPSRNRRQDQKNRPRQRRENGNRHANQVDRGHRQRSGRKVRVRF